MRSPALSRALRVLAIVFRVLAWAIVALVVADAVAPAGPRAWLLAPNELVSALVPKPLLGLGVVPTPFGGALRGDFVALAIVLLVLDWICCRLSASLR